MKLPEALRESFAAVRESAPLQLAAARMGTLTAAALLIATVAGADDAVPHGQGISSALLGFASSLTGAGAAFAASWGATRSEVRRQREDALALKISVASLQSDVSAVREQVGYLKGLIGRDD